MESDSAYLSAILAGMLLVGLGWWLRAVPVKRPGRLAFLALSSTLACAALVYGFAPPDERRDVLWLLLAAGTPFLLALAVVVSPLARRNPWRLLMLVILALLAGLVIGVQVAIALGVAPP